MARRSRTNEIVVIKWRDIPAQINGRIGDERLQVILPRRFQRAIDEAAMVADKKTANEYVTEWRRETMAFDGDLAAMQTAVDTKAADIENEFTYERLQQFVAAGGWFPL